MKFEHLPNQTEAQKNQKTESKTQDYDIFAMKWKNWNRSMKVEPEYTGRDT